MPPRSDYLPRPAGIAVNNAQARGWGTGWPKCQKGRMAVVVRAGVKVFVRKEIAPLVATLLEATEKRYGYDVKSGQTWGYACRAIRGSQKPSNHSWGLAIDINSRTNPMSATFKSDMPPGMVAMWWNCGFYWGGWYRTRPDAMHFEYVGRPGDVSRHLAAARKHLSGPATKATGRGEFSGPPLRLTRPPTRGDRVTWVQERLNVKGAAPKLATDGVWGPKTDAALRAFQKRAHLVVDGIYGPRTHAALAA
ncbi:peptidoglycan-binding protein [Plantactinospora solaniradicis]|uniref:Peptidoglycan-binding protein n=1 Tax=Plantactinospora solaniradicis TaxID=1723736 RepID=A0ABW1KJU8_9ACTN